MPDGWFEAVMFGLVLIGVTWAMFGHPVPAFMVAHVRKEDRK